MLANSPEVEAVQWLPTARKCKKKKQTKNKQTKKGDQGLLRQCASRDSTNQNALVVEWFSLLGRAVFRGVYGEVFALFQACVGNFYPIRPWKVVGTPYLDSSYVILKYFAFLSVCDKFELLGHVQAAMMIWVLFLPFFLDSLLATLSGFIGFFLVIVVLQPDDLFFANFGVYPGLSLIVFQYHMTISRAQVSTHRGDVIYLEAIRWPVNFFTRSRSMFNLILSG